MKKHFLILIILATLVIGTVDKSYAQGIPTFDASVLQQNIQQLFKLAATYQKEVGIDLSAAAIQVNTFKLAYDTTIKRPLNDAMNLITIINSVRQITNLVNGSALVANPEKFVQSRALRSMQADYNTVARQEGEYSDEIMDAIIDEARSEDTSANLADLTQSNVSSQIQNETCQDAKLSDLTDSDLVASGDEDYDQSTFDAHKTELYNALCVGNPKSNPALAKNLRTVNGRSPSWSAWLSTTGGDNAYSKTARAVQEAQKAASTKKHFAELDLNWGEGIQSQKICTKYDDQGVCTEESTINPGSVLSDAFKKAKSMPLTLAMSSFGTGADGGSFFSDIGGLISLGSQAINAYRDITSTVNEFKSTVGSINRDITSTVNGFESAVGSINIDFGDIDAKVVAGRTPNIAQTTRSTYTPNLSGDSEKKGRETAPIEKILNDHLQSLSALTSTDDLYIQDANYYKSLVSGVKSCYANVEAYASSNSYNYSMPQSVKDFYTRENQSADSLIAVLTKEKNTTIPTTKTFLQNQLNRLSSTNSSEEIAAISTEYINKQDAEELTDARSTATRNGDYTTYKLDLQSAQDAQGTIGKQNTECAAADATIKAAIQQRDNVSTGFEG